MIFKKTIIISNSIYKWIKIVFFPIARYITCLYCGTFLNDFSLVNTIKFEKLIVEDKHNGG